MQFLSHSYQKRIDKKACFQINKILIQTIFSTIEMIFTRKKNRWLATALRAL